MASVNDTRSYLASSDEVFQHTCGPCKDEGETKEAKYFCEKCKEHLCFDCRNDHKKFKATKNHSVVTKSSTTTRGTFEIVCGCEQRQAVTVYCEKHGDVICPTCETIIHRNCKTCPIKDKVTKDTANELKELMNKGKSLKAEIESCKKDGEAKCMKLEGKKEECKKEIAAFRREINQILDKMEKDILENLNQIVNQNLKAIEKQISAMTASVKALSTNIDILDNAYKTNREEVMFSANIKLSKTLFEYDDWIQDIRNGMRLPNLKIQQNKKLADLLKNEEILGSIETSEVGSFQQDQVILLGMKVTSTKKVNIQLSDDCSDPQISGCTFLPDGRILLCDFNNSKVKMLGRDMSVTKILELSEKPTRVATVGENEAIIEFSNRYFQYIYTQFKLKLGEKITFSETCHGLYVVNDEIYTICHKSSGHDEIWRLDRAGNILSKIVVTQCSLGCTDYLSLCPAGSIPRVYLSDSDRSTVTCVQVDSKMVYQYQDNGLKGSRGIYVDSGGNSLVCGFSSHNVVIISADGRNLGELLASKDIRKPKSINYRPEDNTLIVGCVNSPYLFVCKLGK